MLSEEVFNKKVKRIYSLDNFILRYNYGEQMKFPEDLEKKFHKNLVFKITEYAALIFQNLRLRQGIQVGYFQLKEDNE